LDGKNVLLKIAVLLTVSVLLVFIFPSSIILKAFAVFFAVFFLFGSYFFRDPRRKIQPKVGQVLSPADGTIVKIVEVNDDFVGENATCISVFMSIFDVHVNRIVFSGVVQWLRRISGKFYCADKDDAQLQNERVEIGIQSNNGNIKMTQIAGAVARRINCHLSKGDWVEIGQKFGSIQFGSRVDIVLPQPVKIRVEQGDKTMAGITILGEFDEN